jgi:hypothetical protein
MNKINEYIHEWLQTFSNEKSHFSSKRLERFAIFSSMLGATIVFLASHIFKCDFTSTELMIVVAGWLGYAGFNIVQGKKDNQIPPNNPPTP